MNQNEEARVSFKPEVGKRGERVMMTVEYGDVGAALDRSVLRIPAYGIYDVMKKEGDRSFSWSYAIPWEAQVKTYEIELYALDANGNKSAVTKVHFQVTA